jgi:hypothetical protein
MLKIGAKIIGDVLGLWCKGEASLGAEIGEIK